MLARPPFPAVAADALMHLSTQAQESGHSTFLALHQPDGSVRLMAYEGGTGECLYDFITKPEFAAFICGPCRGGLEDWDAHRRRAAMKLAR